MPEVNQYNSNDFSISRPGSLNATVPHWLHTNQLCMIFFLYADTKTATLQNFEIIPERLNVMMFSFCGDANVSEKHTVSIFSPEDGDSMFSSETLPPTDESAWH
jgi:hypothetical protein